MFINEIQKQVWFPITRLYNKIQKSMENYSAIQLKESIIAYLNQHAIERENDKYFQSYNFMTTGCPHCKNGGNFAGCTFCDFISPQIPLIAQCSLLCQRNPEFYADTVLHSIQLYRKNYSKLPLILFFTGFDTLSNDEIPDIVLQKLKKANLDLFDNPFTKMIGFDTRAESVNIFKLTKWRELTDKHIGVNIGVEVADEWLRNHWVNKHVQNEQITRAVNLIRKQNYQLSLSALVGIPGLTQHQSIDIFVQTFSWIWTQFHPDTIMCGPLVNREYTLQNTIRKLFSKELSHLGIVGTEASYGTSPIVFLEALSRALTLHPDASRNIRVNPVLFFEYRQTLRADKQNLLVIDLLLECINKNDFSTLSGFNHSIYRSDWYLQFLEQIDSQNGMEKISETMLTTANCLVNSLQPKGTKLLDDFSDEMNNRLLKTQEL